MKVKFFHLNYFTDGKNFYFYFFLISSFYLFILLCSYGATLLKTEMEIEYFPEWSKKTDYSIELRGHQIGVSVTRAMKFGSTFTHSDAVYLLEKKLFGIIISSQNVLKEHGWEKQILHVWASHSYIADIITEEFEKRSSSLLVDTVLILTVCSSDSVAANVFTSNSSVLDCIFHSPPTINC